MLLKASTLTAADKAIKAGKPNPLLVTATKGPRIGQKIGTRLKDGNNLYLLVSDTGAMSWMIMWKKFGKRYELGLGSFTGVGSAVSLSLSEARDRAAAIRDDLRLGKDPKQERAKVGKGKTFKDVMDRYIASRNWTVDRTDGMSMKEFTLRQQITTHAAALLPMMVTADALKGEDIVAVLRPKWGAPTMEVVRSHISRILVHASSEGLRPKGDNPAKMDIYLRSQLGEVKAKVHRKAMPATQLPSFMAELLAKGDNTALAIAFLVLSALRSNECRTMKWSDINFEAKLVTITGERMKEGITHIVPLSDTMLDILSRVQRAAGNDYVWAGDVPGQPVGLKAFGQRMYKMGLKGKADPHGFRAAFSTWVKTDTNYDPETREMALAHKLDAVTLAYMRTDAVEKRRAMMQDWAYHCSGRTGGDSNVVTINGKRAA